MNTKSYARGLVGCMLLALLSCSEKEEVKPDPAGAAGATTLGTDASTPKAWACPEGVARRVRPELQSVGIARS